jgi:CO/xanthine dehydrogenase Mo-binding subunit
MLRRANAGAGAASLRPAPSMVMETGAIRTLGLAAFAATNLWLCALRRADVRPADERRSTPMAKASPMPSMAIGAHLAEVEIDTRTGNRPKVLRLTAAHDVGKAINPAGRRARSKAARRRASAWR